MPRKKKFGRLPTSLYNVYVNDSGKAFNFTMNRMYDMLEEHTYYQEKLDFQAKILSGINTGATDSTNSDVTVIENKETNSLILKIRFTGPDEVYNYLDPFGF